MSTFAILLCLDRFLRVEQWETSDRAEAALSEFRERDPDILEESDAESTVDYAESRMR